MKMRDRLSGYSSLSMQPAFHHPMQKPIATGAAAIWTFCLRTSHISQGFIRLNSHPTIQAEQTSERATIRKNPKPVESKFLLPRITVLEAAIALAPAATLLLASRGASSRAYAPGRQQAAAEGALMSGAAGLARRPFARRPWP